MNNEISISVVIPAYNAEDFLQRSINSVLAQTCVPFEIIFIDDGSLDKTAERVKTYGEQIRYIYQENGGASSARNKGIEASRGDWIAFLDVDDEWCPQHLENAVNVLSKHPKLKWYGAPANQYIHGTGKLIAEYKEKRPGILVDGDYFEDYMVAFPPYAHFSTPTMVIHKSVFEIVGIFNEELAVGEDVDLWYNIGLCFPRVGYCHEVGANIYRRSTSLSFTKGSDYRKSLATFREREALAERLGEKVRLRAEPRIMYWVTKLLKASISQSDYTAVSEIYATYKKRLKPRWRFLTRIVLTAPWLIRPVFSLRNIINTKQRAFRDGGLR